MCIAIRVLLYAAALLAGAQAETRVSREPFGTVPDGTAVEVFTLSDGRVEARVLTYGAVVQSLRVPDRNGKVADVVLGFPSLDGYLGPHNPHFGSLVGRYANRIAGGKFTLNGVTYSIPPNNGPNALHGGPRGFDKVVWKAKQVHGGVELSYVSPDGDQGFPGTMTTGVRYTLSGGALKIEYTATTNKPTVINLSNHSYFNLSGGAEPDILNHELELDADAFTPVDETLIPTGELRPVAGTPFDFRRRHRVGERIDERTYDQIKIGHGYDHNFVLNHPGRMRKIAEVSDPGSGRVLTVSTTEPGVQFYTGNYLDSSAVGKEGRTYNRRAGLCLETQHFPDSPNHPNFPSTVLNPGQRFHSVTVFAFSAR